MRPTQRDVLIAHIDGSVPRVVRNSPRETTTRSLIHRGWLRYDRPFRPRATIITEPGRMALAKALADWADALSGIQDQIAGLMDDARRPLEVPAPTRVWDQDRPPRQRGLKEEVK